ncbi:MAG: anion permease, partial [Chlamydiia bacterium]|nr:anion permease [Chlamydiia bacterium]
LVEVERKGTIIDSPDPDFLLLEGDRLVFIGDIHEIAELHSIKGLKSCQDPKFAFDPASSHFAEVVISTTSLLIGKTVRQTNFRTTYGPSVLAIYRQGRRVEGNVSNTVLMAGDTLMLLSGEAWPANNITSKDFYVIRNVEKLQVFDPFRAFVIISSLIGVVLLAVAGVPLAYASLMAVLVLIFTKSVTLRDAQKGIVWNILLLIACSVAFSKALVSTHAAHYLTQQVYPLIGDSPYQLIAGVLLITILCTELLTNNAAAIILFPFAMELAKLGGYTSPEAIKTIAITIAVGASCCFAVPTGYQTHMIVYGFGGYRFTDFLRAGLPLDFVIFLMVPHIILHFWPLS